MMMETKTTKIGLACLLGGFIGALISLEIARAFAIGEYFWIIGALIGGGISYLTYDLKEIKAGASNAWQKTISWRPDKEWWRVYLKTLLVMPIASSIAMFTVIFYLIMTMSMPLIILLELFPREYHFVQALEVSLLASVLMGFSVYIMMIICIVGTNREIEEIWNDAEKLWDFMIRVLNPIVFPFAVLYYAGRELLWLIASVPVGLATFGRFIKETFIYIHSEERILCLIDGSLGAAIGFFLGSAIIGGVAGLIFGVINYELISKYTLGIVKNK